MSVDATEIPNAEVPEGGGVYEAPPSGNFLTRTFFGLPVWTWGIIVIGGGILAFFLIKNLGGQQNADTSTSPNGLQIDPTTGLQTYSTGGVNGGINPAGAFAGETQFNPLGDQNALLQQILANQQGNVSPGTSTGTNTLVNGYATSGGETLNQSAARYGKQGSTLYYSQAPQLVQLKAKINEWWSQQGKPGDPSQKFANVIIPAGTPVYIGSAQAA